MKRVYTLIALLALLGALAAPFVLIYYYRTQPKRSPRIHLVLDMDNQPKYKAQSASLAFADGRSMRPPLENTVEYSLAPPDETFEKGLGGEAWIEGFPEAVAVDDTLRARGAERFSIYCAPCHGPTGAGDGAVAKAAERRGETAWVAPTVLDSPDIIARANGHLFNTITQGIRSMPGYGSQISTRDRWAIVAYLRELQEASGAAAAGN